MPTPTKRSATQPSTDPLTRLSEAVRLGRAQLGISQAELARRGNLSGLTVRSVEGARKAPRPLTLAGLDLGLGWPTGTAQAVLDGAEAPAATTTPQPEPTTGIEERLARIERQVARLTHQLDAIGTVCFRDDS